MKAIILSVGSELLRGDIVDTNAAFIARSLAQWNFSVVGVRQIGDDRNELTGAVRSALTVADLVVTTGGLGPTQDDLTRDAIAGALDEQMFSDPTLRAGIEARFAGMQRRMPDSNFRQALRIPSAEALPNPNGTAPGWYVSRDERIIVALPGPPREMQPMWEEAVLPRLSRGLDQHLAMLAIMTFGVGESTVEQRIENIIGRDPAVTVATYAKSNGVQVHITARGASSEDAETRLKRTVNEVRDRLGDAVFGTGDETLALAVGRMLDAEDRTIATMESATGGELASMITNNPGSSRHFIGGIVAYSRDVKVQFGVDPETCDRHGLVSAEVAVEMARAACRSLGGSVGVGITGIAGTEPVEGKAPGTCFVAVSIDGRDEVLEIHRPGARDVAKRFFAQCALDLVRRQLLAAVDATV